MLRTRLLWFTAGFSVAGAVIGRFVWKDLWTDRYALFADTKQKFDTLEARVSNLESNLHKKFPDYDDSTELLEQEE